MDGIGAILDAIREMECPCCGARLASCGIRGITTEPTALIVRLACSLCGENSIALVKRDPREMVTPITRDDVLDAHEFLKVWHGRVADIVSSKVA